MEQFDDDTLVALAKQGDTHAELLLCHKYMGFAKKIGKEFAFLYRDLGIGMDDFTAVAFSSVAIAIKKYNVNHHNSFYSYWMAIAKHQCINYIHDNSYIDLQSVKPLSFDSASFENGLTLHETYGSIDHSIEFEISAGQLREFILSMDSGLTDEEKLAAYYLFLCEYDYDDLIALTKWKKSKAYRVVAKARMKVSNFIKSGYFKD